MTKFNAILLAIVILAHCVQAQKFEIYNGDTINRIDTKGKKQGKWIYFNKDYTGISQTGEYKDQLRTGTWVSYYDSGNVKTEITYKNSIRDGYAKAYHENGNVLEEGYWRKNRWVGEYKGYYDNGNLFYVWNYDNQGRRTGEQRYFYNDGSLAILGNWEQGEKNGLIREFNKDGSTKRDKLYELGKHAQTKVYNKKDEHIKNPIEVFDGTGFFTLYKNGKVASEGNYVDGKLIDGKKNIYDENGEEIRVETYKNGLLVK